MTRRFDIAVIGADSPLGAAVLEQLANRRFPAGEVSALAQAPDEEATVDFAGSHLLVERSEDFEFSSVQIAFLADDNPQLVGDAERAADTGCVVIDAVGVNWRDSQIPQVIPEINADALARFSERGIVASTDRLSVPLVLALMPLQRAFGLRRVVLTAIVPASDGGRAAMEDLARETTALLNARHYQRRHFAQQIAFNVLGQHGAIDGSGASEREQRIAGDLRSMTGCDELPVSVSLLHAGVFYGYGINVELDLAEAADLHQVAEALRKAPDIEFVDSPDAEDCPSPVTDATSTDAVRVARLRSGSVPGSVRLWITAGNIRRAGALNALQIAERLARDYL